jgi:hypothetical protein
MTTRACLSCGGILLGRRTRFCSSCAPKRGGSDPRYGSRQWKRTVKVVKARDGYRCQHCGTTERLVVDHKTPHDRYPGRFSTWQIFGRSARRTTPASAISLSLNGTMRLLGVDARLREDLLSRAITASAVSVGEPPAPKAVCLVAHDAVLSIRVKLTS